MGAEYEKAIETLGAGRKARVSTEYVLGGHIDDREVACDHLVGVRLDEVTTCAANHNRQFGLSGHAVGDVG